MTDIFLNFARMNLHVVSFQVPFPADFGGAIDVFWKLQALRQEGHSVTLHTYVYADRQRQPLLEQLCQKVYYYPRLTGWRQQFTLLPYIVSTRRSQVLLANLLSDDAPILFEGLHTCFHLDHPALAQRWKAVRMHNIEHDYYRQLARQSPLGWKRLYYLIESWRLKRFEHKLASANLVYAITQADQQGLKKLLPETNVQLMPCFFDIRFPAAQQATQPFVLFQGNLAVAENAKAARYIISQVAPLLPDVSFVIAGRSPHLGQVPANVRIVANPTDEQMEQLTASAQIHLLLTFQPTGIKLKLLYALVRGNGHIVANSLMLHGHDLGQFCTVADTAGDMAQHIKRLLSLPLTSDDLARRRSKLLSIRQQAVSQFALLQPNLQTNIH